MIVHDCEQRSEAWYALRAGKVTGSCAQAIIQQRKKGTGELAIRRDLRHRLTVERLTGRPVDEGDGYQSKDMIHGMTAEPDAFAAYEAAYREIVTRVGFVSHDELHAGCSPDGYVGNWEGILEIKCPASSTHLEYVKANTIPEEYYGQLLHALWITGAQWADFCSYDARFPEHMRLFTKRLLRNEEMLTAYELAVRLFLSEVDKDVAALLPEVPCGV